MFSRIMAIPYPKTWRHPEYFVERRFLFLQKSKTRGNQTGINTDIMATSLQKWNEMIADDVQVMHSMLDRIVERMSNHLNGEEKYRYIVPIKNMIYEAFLDITENNGVPTFTTYVNPPKPTDN